MTPRPRAKITEAHGFLEAVAIALAGLIVLTLLIRPRHVPRFCRASASAQFNAGAALIEPRRDADDAILRDMLHHD